MQQYFIDQAFNVDDLIGLDEEIIHHLRKVLRKSDGIKIRVVSSDHKLYLAELYKDKAKIIEGLDEKRELDHELVLAMALIKHDRFEWAIQKATELGVTKIIPMITERVMIKDDSEKKRLVRYKKIIKEAAEQSLRTCIPEITDFMTLDEVSDLDYKRKIIAYEKEDDHKLIEENTDTLVVIGPEGGFSDDEYHKLVDKGFKSISLGRRILRAETAACAALVILGRGME